MGKGDEGWQTQECTWVGHSSLTSWFLWRSFKRTRKVFPLKSLRERMVCPPAPSPTARARPRTTDSIPVPESSEVHSEGPHNSMFPEESPLGKAVSNLMPLQPFADPFAQQAEAAAIYLPRLQKSTHQRRSTGPRQVNARMAHIRTQNAMP